MFALKKKIFISQRIVKIAVCFLIVTALVASVVFAVSQKRYAEVAVDAKNEKTNYNFLLLGVDRSKRLSDVIMLASLDIEKERVTVAQIPRDTYAEYTSAAYRKLNGAVSALDGGRSVADFLERIFEINIDYYVTLDLDAMAKIVDSLGGVEVTIPENMEYEDCSQGLSIKLEAGKQLLDGDKAMQFIRYRAGYVRGDLARLDAQKIFLAALFDKIVSSGATDIVEVAQNLLSYSKSDIPLIECIKIVSKATKFKSGEVWLLTMPGSDVKTGGGTWYYILNKKETYNVLHQYFGCEAEYTEFDRERALTGEYSKEFNNIYDADSGYECHVYSAEAINSEGIRIEKTN